MGAWLGVAALVVEVIAIPVSTLVTRQWGNRRAKVEFAVASIPLLPRNTREGFLELHEVR